MTEKSINLMEKLFRVVGLMHRLHHHSQMEHGPFASPHRGQGRVLAILKMQPEISQKDLGYLLDMRAQSLGELLAKLEKNGFITRAQSEEDQRVMNIKLTEKGAQAAAGAAEQDEEEGFFSTITRDEEKTLGAILDKVIKELESKTGAPEGEDPREAFRAHFDMHGHMGHSRDTDGHGGRDFDVKELREELKTAYRHGGREGIRERLREMKPRREK
ncbi:MAG: MarR family transcriptional regulator [Elusimicrobiota bacterium]|jgi:DNA-binding MarR family transcriptional regulator|nr:MarR family transcriptional regulator [Elusimicrobiota bacterium]